MGYVLYSALGSFYLPSCIMVFVYIRIYYAAKKRARRGINKKSRKLDPVSCGMSTPISGSFNVSPRPFCFAVHAVHVDKLVSDAISA